MQRRSVVLASAAILVVASGAAWWWISGDTAHSVASARTDEDESAGRRAAALESAMSATTDAPPDASRDEAPDPFDPKHTVRIPARELRIHVFDELDGTPIEGVTFSLDKYEVAGLPPLGTAVSGSDGMATYTIPTDRRLHLTVEANGFTLEKLLVPEEPIGTPEQPLAIALPRTASIHGRLFGPAGEPLPADHVSLHSDSGNRGITRSWNRPNGVVFGRSSRSDATRELESNEFLFEGVPAEIEIELHAVHGEHDERQESQTLCLEPGERRELEWRLGSSSGLSGRVVDEAGEPLAGAILNPSLGSWGLVFIDSADSSPKSDANGEFELGGLDAGRCVVEVGAPDPRHANGSFTCVLAPGEHRRGVVIELPRAAPLTVRARLADGTVPAYVNASATTPADRFTVRRPAANGVDGAVTINAVPLGDVDVEVFTRTDASEASGHVRFHHDGEHECEVDCSALASLHGSVELASGKPVNATAQVSLIRRGDASRDELFRNSAETKSNGFEIKAARAGTFDVVATTPDGLVGVLPSVSLAAGEQREGAVVRMEPGALLRLLAPSLDDRAAASLRNFDLLEVRVLCDGACVARSGAVPGRHCELPVPPGRLTVEVWSSGARVASREVEARAFEVARVRF